jgi:hypothetical protein
MGCLFLDVRNVRIKLLAISLLLILFTMAGAVLMWQETSPEKKPDVRNSFAVNLYPNALLGESDNASRFEQKTQKSGGSRLAVLLWLGGLPLASLAGFAIGLTTRRQHNQQRIAQMEKSQYAVIKAISAQEFSKTVLKKSAGVLQRDNSESTRGPRTSSPRDCRNRYRITSFSNRQNQPP